MILNFLNPLFLIGLIAVAAPVLLHILSRQKRRRIPFSTLYFLRKIDVQSAKRHKLTDILLLLLRTLMLLLITLALARPVLRPANRHAPSIGEATRIIILDDSYSTRLKHEQRPLFEREREFARAAVETLRSGDDAAILMSSGFDSPGTASPTGNTAILLDAVEKSAPSDSGTPLASALERAISILAQSQKPLNEIILITDMQKHAFAPPDAMPNEEMRKIRPQIYICPVRAGQNISNMTIEKVFITSPLPLAGFPVIMEATVRNQTERALDSTANLWTGNELLMQKKLSIPPSASTIATFTFSPKSTSEKSGYLTVESDDLDSDNTYYFNIGILKSLHTLIVTSEGTHVMEKDGSLFLATALEPLETGDAEAPSGGVDYASPDDLASISLKTYSILFFVDVIDIAETPREALKKFIRDGGCALFFLGSSPNTNSSSGSIYTDPDFFPFIIQDTWEVNAGEGATDFGEWDRTHPVTQSLRKIPNLDFSTVSFYKGWRVRFHTADTTARILVYTRNDNPLIIENNRGKGRIVTFASGLSPEWNNLASRPVFIPLLYELIKNLLESKSRVYATVGDSIKLPMTGPLEVTTPDGTKYTVTPEKGESTFNHTRLAGNYTCHATQTAGAIDDVFSVNVDPAEGNMEWISNNEAKKLFPEVANVTVCPSPESLGLILAEGREGKALWHYLMLGALLLFLLESHLAGRLLPRKEKGTGETG
ncbi:MAG: BatA and WFA domain-containing protein [Candidatus Sumerlaeota bacterium]|nr:BatA and WFA domain-containing protein [Candidatus Sumerlaeota bacterium]